MSVKIKIKILGIPIRITLSESDIAEILSAIASTVGSAKLQALVATAIAALASDEG